MLSATVPHPTVLDLSRLSSAVLPLANLGSAQDPAEIQLIGAWRQMPNPGQPPTGSLPLPFLLSRLPYPRTPPCLFYRRLLVIVRLSIVAVVLERSALDFLNPLIFELYHLGKVVLVPILRVETRCDHPLTLLIPARHSHSHFHSECELKRQPLRLPNRILTIDIYSTLKKHAHAMGAPLKDDLKMPTATITARTVKGETNKHSKQPPRRQHTVPERGSLWDIMHEHQGTSLYVLPICWTDLHTRLLGCRFIHRPPQTTPTPTVSSSPKRSPRASSAVVGIGRDLDTLMGKDTPRNVMAKTRALRSVISTLFPTHLCKPKSNAELSLRFGSRVYHKATRAQVIWKHHDASMSFDSATTWTSSRSTSQLMASMSVNIAGDTPVLAYVSRSNLNHIRHNCFRILQGPNRSPNTPVHRLQTLRSKNLIPSNLDEDPHFVATIIALAQQQLYPDGFRASTITARDITVRLFTTSEEDEAFIIYTATVPAAFLMMFHEPHKAPKGDAELKIDYTHVPVWPVLGLKERLSQVLGHELVGAFDPLKLETFADEEEEIMGVAQTTSPKRRRDVLSEVLNVSFSEDRESANGDELSIMGKRRCLEEGVENVEEESANRKGTPGRLTRWRKWAVAASSEDRENEEIDDLEIPA
ncbi:hypothetical protein SCUP234_09718 [Seiridium cupressi]